MTLRPTTTPIDGAALVSALASAEVLTVVDITNPTELASRAGTSVGVRCTCVQVAANDNIYTEYLWDTADGSGASSPYVVAGSGGYWIAVAGRYVNSAVGIRGTITSSSLTSGRVAYVSTAGLVTDNAKLLFSTALAVVGSAGPGLSVGDGTASNPSLVLNGGAGQYRFCAAQTAGVNRWTWGGNTVAEAGSNAGTDYDLEAYDDAGVLIDRPIRINRASAGNFAISRPITAASTLRTVGRGGISTSSISTIALLSVGEGAVNSLTGSNQQGARFDITGTSAATTAVLGFVCQTRTTAASYTCALAGGAYMAFAQLGAGSTVTRCFGALAEAPSVGANNAGLVIIAGGGSAAWTGNYAIRSESTLPSLFAGGITSANATAGVGYATGAGGTVTQATSKSTGVTLNTVSGAITMNAAALTAAAKVSFVLTDSAIAATDGVLVWVASGGTANAYRADITAVAAGSCTITVENITAGSLSEAPVIGFAVIKAATA